MTGREPKPALWSHVEVAGFLDADDPYYYAADLVSLQEALEHENCDYDIVWLPPEAVKPIRQFGNVPISRVDRIRPIGPKDRETVESLLADAGVFPDGNGLFSAETIKDLVTWQSGRHELSRAGKFWGEKGNKKYPPSARLKEAVAYMFANEPSAFDNILKAVRRVTEENALFKVVTHKEVDDANRIIENKKAVVVALRKQDRKLDRFCELFLPANDTYKGDPRSNSKFRELAMPAFLEAIHAARREIWHLERQAKDYFEDQGDRECYSRSLAAIEEDRTFYRLRLAQWKGCLWPNKHYPSLSEAERRTLESIATI